MPRGRHGSHPILGTVIFVWGGAPFLTGALSELRALKPGMMLLIGLAITVAFVASWGATLGILDHELDFWWELSLLIVIMLLGHWLEMRSLAQTTSALDSLAALLPDEAERVEGDGTVTVAPADLSVGDVVVVRPGGRVPADGRIVQGSASMDEAMITGESRPVRRGAGDQVVAGTVATDSGLRVQITAVGDDTALAGIQRLVAEAQNSTSRAQRLADRAAGWLFWFALIAAAITATVWTLLGMPDEAVVRTITVLVIACPHALGLAIPLVVSIATERAARSGVLIKDRLALESMRTVDTVLFDKTGTLTKGTPAVTAIEPVAGITPDELLSLAAAAESDSEHPLARAIVAAAREKQLVVPASTGFESSPAVGVRARVGDRTVQVGGPYLLEQEGSRELPVADELAERGSHHPARPHRRHGGRRAAARGRDPPRIARRCRRAPRPGRAGRDDHRRRGSRRRIRRRRARHRPVLRRRAPRRQGLVREAAAGGGPQSRHGRRRRERRAGARRRRMSASRSAPAPTSRSHPRASSSPATTPVRCCR